jgi:hypothetical protein
MDTGDAVIAPLTRDKLGVRATLPGRNLAWAGGETTWAAAGGRGRALGLAELAFSARDRGDFYTFQNSKGDAGYGGFGFGKAIGSNEQKYLWENREVGKTVFEVAVKAEELTEGERKMFLSPGKVEVFEASWGPVGKKVDVLKKLAGFAKGDGDVECLVNVANLGEVPASGGLRELAVSYAVNGEKRSMTLPEGRNLWLIAPAVRGAAAPGGGGDRGAPVAPPQTDGAGWTVLFRGDDPALWNTDTGNPDMITGFAAGADKAPAGAQYLRMRRLDTGDAVIVPVGREMLATGGTVNGVLVWSAGTQTWRGARLLGIGQEAGAAETAGELFVYRNGMVDGGYRGWGFGKAVGKDFEQMYTWNGQGIEKTVFEIAVKAKALTPAERQMMLSPGQLVITDARWGAHGKTVEISKKLQALVANGALEVPLVAGELLGPAGAAPRELTVTFDANGARETRKFKEGETLVLAAPVVMAGSAPGARAAPPTMAEIQASLQAEDYAGTLKMIAQVLPLTMQGGNSYDRYTLLVDRAECLLQGKDRAGALAALQVASREAKSPDGNAAALAFGALVQRSPNYQFLVGGPKAPGLPILKPADRKAAYGALWKEQEELMVKHASAAEGATLPPILQAAGEIPLARAAEFMATGSSAKTTTHGVNLARRAATLISEQIARDLQRSDEIGNAAAGSGGLKPEQARELQNLMAATEPLAGAMDTLGKALGEEPFKQARASLEALRGHLREVGNRRY